MDYIVIAVLIITVVGTIHVVREKGIKRGIAMGIGIGRMQILEENIIRQSTDRKSIVNDVNQYTEPY